MTTILTLDIKLSGWRTGANSWSAQVEVPDSFTLSELHYTILRLVNFNNDHLHEFFAGRNGRDRKMTFGEPAPPFEINKGEEVPLSEVFPLPKGQKLYYNFDFGDDWLFEIACHPEAKQADRKTKKARLIHEKGHRPIQYPSEDDEGYRRNEADRPTMNSSSPASARRVLILDPTAAAHVKRQVPSITITSRIEMTALALIIKHKTQPGRRDEVRRIWEKHMAPAIAANPGHTAYFYCFDNTDPDSIWAFQQYSSVEASREFLQTGSYAAYLKDVEPSLAGSPQITALTPMWSKGTSQETPSK